MNTGYVHGYDERESSRLHDQAGALVDLLHADTSFPAGSRVLEAGCGVGAQTVTLARNSPDARIVSVDVSADSLFHAQARVEAAGLHSVELMEADLFDLPFDPGSFDHVFVCFLLEHLAQPVEALLALKRLLRTAGTITVNEGDHGSAFFHPDSQEARDAIQCQVALQRAAGGNALIGRQLYPLLISAGFHDIDVSVEGVRDAAIGSSMAEPEAFDAGIRALHRTAADDGVFCYTFFKAVARTAAPGR